MKYLKNRKNKYIFFFFLLILSIFTIGLAFVIVNPLAATFDINEENFYITSGDVIRNFKFDSFGDYQFDSSGSIIGLDNRLKTELGAQWIASPEDIKTLYVEQVGDIVYINYDVTFTRKLNVYTNTRLNDVVATGKTADPVTEKFLTAEYTHYGCFGGEPQIHTYSYLYFTHLDVGNIRTHNAQYNTFSGDLQMSFDIDPSPLPDTLVDSNGNTANKSFDYIGVKTVYVKDSTNGLLSDEVPYTVGLTPSQYDLSEDDVSVGGVPTYADAFKAEYVPDTILGKTYKSDTFDLGIQSQSIGSYLNPTQKNGADLFDPKTSEESMTDCEFSYNVGSLSPLVTSYSNTLSYDKHSFSTQLYWYGATGYFSSSSRESATRVTALQVSNRYIQTELAVTFSVWSSYDVVAVESDLPDLQNPQEYYDDLVFSSVVDGFGGGETTTAIPNFWSYLLEQLMNPITTILMILFVIAFVGVILYIAAKRLTMKKLKSKL